MFRAVPKINELGGGGRKTLLILPHHAYILNWIFHLNVKQSFLNDHHPLNFNKSAFLPAPPYTINSGKALSDTLNFNVC